MILILIINIDDKVDVHVILSVKKRIKTYAKMADPNQKLHEIRNEIKQFAVLAKGSINCTKTSFIEPYQLEVVLEALSSRLENEGSSVRIQL